MKPIDIYSLTRIDSINNLKRMERQMSERSYFLNIKKWETDCLKEVADKLYQENTGLENMKFYYSFQIPKLGKEFDLLKITEDYVINVELKSGDVTDDKIKKQLLRNRYYLASLGKTIRSYTYISDEDRLVRLTNSENLVESSFDKLVADIHKAIYDDNNIACNKEYAGDIEDLFKEENYIISPLTDPERFLRRDYFLTSQQNDIRKHIVKNVRENTLFFQGFTGLPGTGKTLLLYDIAMEISYKQKVCVLHFGSYPDELEKLDERLKRIDFYKCQTCSVGDGILKDSEGNDIRLDLYQAILIDEGHRITEEILAYIKTYGIKEKVPVIISYDSEEAVSQNEKKEDPSVLIESLPDYEGYHITNRIRMNIELSSFINCLMHPSRYRRRMSYPNISVSYANDYNEANAFLVKYISDGYVYISKKRAETEILNNAVASDKATCKEYDKVVMRIGSAFSYDEEGYLRYSDSYDGESPVRALFHGLNRAKKKVAVVIVENDEMIDEVLRILQGEIK